MSGILQGLLGSFGAKGIQFVGYAYSTYLDGTYGSVSLTSLSGGIDTQARTNDLVIVFTARAGVSSGGTAPLSGNNTGTYTFASNGYLYANDTNDTEVSAVYKVQGVAPDTNVSGPSGGASVDGLIYMAYVWRGINTTTPFDTSLPTPSALTTNSGIPNPPSITPVTSGAVIVAFGAGAVGSSTGGSYTSSDLTNFQTSSVGSSRVVITGVGHKAWTSGAFDPAAFGLSGISDSTANSAVALTLALKPA